jgi:hypothetical protein
MLFIPKNELEQAIQTAAEASVPEVFDIRRVDRRNSAAMTSALLQAQPFYQRRAPSCGNPTLN